MRQPPRQPVDILSWKQQGDELLAWFHPMSGAEIAQGATLVVADGQTALVVNQGQIADLFDTGIHVLTATALPILHQLKNWERLAQSPMQSEICFFNLRAQSGRPWRSRQALTVPSRDFGAITLQAGGLLSYRLRDVRRLFGALDANCKHCSRSQVESALQEAILSVLAHTLSTSAMPLLELVSDLERLARLAWHDLYAALHRQGFLLDDFSITELDLPEEVQLALDLHNALPTPDTIGGPWLDSILLWQTAPAAAHDR